MSIAEHLRRFGRFPDDSADFTKLPDMEIIQTPIEDLIVFRPTPDSG